MALGQLSDPGDPSFDLGVAWQAYYRDIGRIDYGYATDDDVLEAFQLLCRVEGIIPALESTHALAYTIKRAPQMDRNQIIVMNLSGRGDKDVNQVAKFLGQDV